MHTRSLYIQDNQKTLKVVVNTASPYCSNSFEDCATKLNYVYVVRVVYAVQLGWHLRIRSLRVLLSFDWPTPAVKCSNFGGNVKMHAKAVAFGECVPRTSGLSDQSLLAF